MRSACSRSSARDLLPPASLAIALTLSAFSAAGQTPQNSNLRLAALKFSGLDKINEQHAAAGTGLHPGDPITISQLSVVADQMAKTGEFQRVAFQYSTRGDELTAVFTVVENKPLLSCLYDNFVWYSDDQLEKTLRARVPFYSGVTPMTGSMEQQITDALRQLLQSNGYATADVQVLPSPGPGGSGNVMLFRATGVSMPIKTLSFPGATAISEKDVQTAAASALGQDFSITNMADFSSAVLIPFYHQRGYLRAAFNRPLWSIIGEAVVGSPPDIALTIPVKEGSQYLWHEAVWSGNQELSADQLNQSLAMQNGEIADEKKMEDGLRAVHTSYEKIGLIDARVQPRLNLDDSKLLAAYDVTIIEGVQYHMGRVLFAGIPANAAADLAAKWQLKSGAIYDGTYASEFVDKIALRRLSKLGIKKSAASFALRRSAQNATVDLDIVFH